MHLSDNQKIFYILGIKMSNKEIAGNNWYSLHRFNQYESMINF